MCSPMDLGIGVVSGTFLISLRASVIREVMLKACMFLDMLMPYSFHGSQICRHILATGKPAIVNFTGFVADRDKPVDGTIWVIYRVPLAAVPCGIRSCQFSAPWFGGGGSVGVYPFVWAVPRIAGRAPIVNTNAFGSRQTVCPRVEQIPTCESAQVFSHITPPCS